MDRSLFRRAADGFGARVDAIPATGWSAATPCDGWDVRALVNHIVGELLWAPPLLAGATIAEVGDRFDGDVLGDDPAAAFHAAAGGAVGAVEALGDADPTVHLSFGDAPASEYLDQLTSDLTIHAWDLATGAGGDTRLDPDLVDAVHAFLAPQADSWRSAGIFGPAVETAGSAPLQDQLLALTGRRPQGTRPS